MSQQPIVQLGAPDTLQIDILDVGQGDGIVVWFPNGKTMMIDLGSTKNKGLVTDDSFKYFTDHTKFAKKGETLDYLVLTHADRDHYNMVIGFVERFDPRIHTVIRGGAEGDYSGKDNKTLIRWLQARMKSQHGIDLEVIGRYTRYPAGVGPKEDSVKEFGAEVYVLCMGLQVTGEPGYVKNSRSVVLQLRYPPNRVEQATFLLTGDATRDVENFILDTYDKFVPQLLRSDVLKIGHHGSHRTSNQARWLQAVNPVFAFVTSDRSGALDEDQKATGHRLPQHLTIDLLKKYAPRLSKKTENHPYVSSYQESDYQQYNAAPDIPGEKLPLPNYATTDGWIQHVERVGIFSTLATIGVGEYDPDHGVQYRLVATKDGNVAVHSTADFSTFDRTTGKLD